MKKYKSHSGEVAVGGGALITHVLAQNILWNSVSQHPQILSTD